MPHFISNTIQLHVAAKIKDNFKYLVLRRSLTIKVYPGIWQVITGTIEPNEKAIDTALRELREETGLIPLKFWTLPYITNFFDVKMDLIHSAPVFGAYVDYVEEIKLSDEHCEFEWLNFEDCLEKLELPTHIDGTKIFKEYILEKENSIFPDLLSKQK